MTRFYAGVGSRATPESVCFRITAIAQAMRDLGMTLRSGGADRADSAFELGALGEKEIFLPEDATPEAIELSSRFHPNWSACSGNARRKHGRNAMIVLGRDLCTPVELVICWTPRGEYVGGTAQAMRIADAWGIPVQNLATHPQVFDVQRRLL